VYVINTQKGIFIKNFSTYNHDKNKWKMARATKMGKKMCRNQIRDLVANSTKPMALFGGIITSFLIRKCILNLHLFAQQFCIDYF